MILDNGRVCEVWSCSVEWTTLPLYCTTRKLILLNRLWSHAVDETTPMFLYCRIDYIVMILCYRIYYTHDPVPQNRLHTHDLIHDVTGPPSSILASVCLCGSQLSSSETFVKCQSSHDPPPHCLISSVSWLLTCSQAVIDFMKNGLLVFMVPSIWDLNPLSGKLGGVGSDYHITIYLEICFS